MKQNTVDKYLRTRACLDRWPLVHGTLAGIEQVVAIPVLAESAFLFDTLESLGANAERELARTLVICVVNNRPPGHAEPADVEDNQAVLARLDKLVRTDQKTGTVPSRSGADTFGKTGTVPSRSGTRSLGTVPVFLAYVDASSPGKELPEKDGVGLARKIGLDWGLWALRESGTGRGLLLLLDADTVVAPNYLEAVRNHFETNQAWAGVVAYAHRPCGQVDLEAAIVCYELFLRYHALGLWHAGSPYALHAIGSTIMCSAEAYAAAAGMNRRQAGEDFYFLQQLTKTGRVDSIKTTTVYPSGRASARVPFGTGLRVRRFRDDADAAYRVYHPDSYGVIKQWLGIVARRMDDGPGAMLDEAQAVCPALRAFLDAACFERTWRNLSRHSADKAGLLAQFHRWFDGLKTLRLIHHLRDNGFPEQDLFEALRALLDMTGNVPSVQPDAGFRADLDRQKELLAFLRSCAP